MTFTVEQGEWLGVLGPNGAGKTTLARLAAGSLRCGAGRVLLGGDNVTDLSSHRRARRIAIVPQETQLAFPFSVREIVAMGRAPYQGLLGIADAADRAAIETALERTGLTRVAGRRFHELSGGERQRVIVARALAQASPLLLLDEPTAFLDLRHRVATYELLQRLHRESGLSIVMISHDINMAARYCPRLLLLDGGRIAAVGTPEEVVRSELIRDAYGIENDVRRDPVTGAPSVTPLASR